MELTKKERLGFIYQLRILEALYPDDADHYAKHRTALEEGYALQYDWLLENVADDMSEAKCRQVLDILDMYRAITFRLSEMPADDPLREHHLAKFTGFDGNNETRQMAYARYFVVDLDRYSELRQDEYPYFNSHCPMLSTYETMLERWNAAVHKHKLTRDEVATILGAE